MPDKIANPIPAWLTESPSVLDSPLKRAMQMIGSLIGADNPTSQVLGMAGAMEVPGKLGGLAGAVDRLLTKAGIKAYHGSPHDFDQFSTEKIGTGEGAQAYGHGLYFAEDEGVAKYYQMKSPVPVKSFAEGKASAAWHRQSGDRDQAIRLLSSVQPLDADTAQAIQLLRQGYSPPKSRMYEVSIAAHPDDFLDWDKPLSQQSETVKEALLSNPRVRQMVDAQSKILNRPVDPKGQNAYGYATGWKQGVDLSPSQSEAAKVSGELREAGVPGIKYLDAGSRAGGMQVFDVRWDATGTQAEVVDRASGAVQGLFPSFKEADAWVAARAPQPSRNYVVFDDKLVSILKKYGVAGALAAGYSQSDVDAAQSHP